MYLLEQIELQIARVKDEALCRKEILEKVEKWLAACQEESWLEEYNRVEHFFLIFKHISIFPHLALFTFLLWISG